MRFLLEENTSATALCEFWHSRRLPGSVPLHFWVCSKRPSGFGVVSCWFSVNLSHVISVHFPHKADVLSNLKRVILSWAWLGSWVSNIGVWGGALWQIGLVSIWYDSAALKPESCCLFCFLSSFNIIYWPKREKKQWIGLTASVLHSPSFLISLLPCASVFYLLRWDAHRYPVRGALCPT